MAEWITLNENVSVPVSDLMDYVNVYSFINTFGITKDQAEAALAYRMGEDAPTEIKITSEDIEMLYSEDVAEVATYFASEYSIVVGSRVFSPYWMFMHNADDYKNAGITPEMVKEKEEVYSKLDLPEEINEMFKEKCSEYSKEIK